jgi:hypothetical protein
VAQDFPDPANLPRGVPGFFASTNAIDTYFAERHVPREAKQAQNGPEIYYFVLAYPYSGTDTTELYCFVRGGEGWTLFLQASLWQTPPKTVELEVSGEFIDVLRSGDVTIRLKAPRGRAGSPHKK